MFARVVTDILATLRDYYRQPPVRARMLEFLGADEAGDFTAEYITADTTDAAERTPLLPWELAVQLEAGRDICRSLADRDSLIAHLDIEYVNFDFPAEAYLDPVRAFALQEPLEAAVKRVLGHYGIEALHVLSGRGHHFIWRIHRASRVFARLADAGRSTQLNDSLLVRRRDGLDTPSITCAFAGLGLLMEFVARLVIDLSARETAIPVAMTAVEVGPSGCGREMVSIDLSEYADPLPMRTIRIPYSGYLKPWQQPYAVGQANLPRIGPIIFVTLDVRRNGHARGKQNKNREDHDDVSEEAFHPTLIAHSSAGCYGMCHPHPGPQKSWATLPHRRMALCKRGLACEGKLTARPCTN